jgi:hypothetical protein
MALATPGALPVRAAGEIPTDPGPSQQVRPLQPASIGNNIHWGQSPYYPNCTEGPCRVVLVIDKTFDSRFNAQIRRWVDWMNYVRVTYNLNLNAYAYYGPAEGVQPDGGCSAADGMISVCINDSTVSSDCNTTGGIGCGGTIRAVSPNHTIQARSSFRASARSLSDANVWTLVCHELGHSIGLGHNDAASPRSCMASAVVAGDQERYYEGDDWSTLFSINAHPAGS